MIRGIGLDVIVISRMRKSLERSGFKERVFTPQEIRYASDRADPGQSAAGLFAAKEAVLKAMGIGIGAIPLTDVEILHTDKGAPFLNMITEEGAVLISITHMGDIAAAVAVWEV